MMRFLCLLLVCLGIARAEEPAMEEKPLEKIHATILVPKGWFVSEEGEDGVWVYTISREKPDQEGASSVGLILQVTTKVKERTEMTASEYAADMLSAMQEDAAPPLEQSEDGPYKSFQNSSMMEDDQGAVRTINLAKANDKTDTLYYLTWHAPDSESTTLEPIREKIFGSLKFDPTF